jgi:hypothetical protein
MLDDEIYIASISGRNAIFQYYFRNEEKFDMWHVQILVQTLDRRKAHGADREEVEQNVIVLLKLSALLKQKLRPYKTIFLSIQYAFWTE